MRVPERKGGSMGKAEQKKLRHKKLQQKIEENPFLKDEELAQQLKVSVATIRLDRAEMGIREYRERIKNVAASELSRNSSAQTGDLLDLNPYHDGISVMTTDDSMTFAGTDIVKGQAVFSFAENLALHLLNAKTAVIKVANVKFSKEIKKGDKLIAKFEVKRVKDTEEYIVWVRIKVELKEVFRGKFNMLVTENVNTGKEINFS